MSLTLLDQKLESRLYPLLPPLVTLHQAAFHTMRTSQQAFLYLQRKPSDKYHFQGQLSTDSACLLEALFCLHTSGGLRKITGQLSSYLAGSSHKL